MPMFLNRVQPLSQSLDSSLALKKGQHRPDRNQDNIQFLKCCPQLLHNSFPSIVENARSPLKWIVSQLSERCGRNCRHCYRYRKFRSQARLCVNCKVYSYLTVIFWFCSVLVLYTVNSKVTVTANGYFTVTVTVSYRASNIHCQYS
jgi:hypothetical protein